MNEKNCCITNGGKTTKNEWENDDSDLLQALYIVYKNISTNLFHTYLLTSLSKAKSFLLKV